MLYHTVINDQVQEVSMIIDTPEGIEAYRLLAIRGRLSLELKGMKSRVNTFAYVKREYGFKGQNKAVFAQYEEMLRGKGLL